MSRLYIGTLLINFYAEYVMWNPRLDKAQVVIKIGRNVNNFRYADDTTLVIESEEELKSLLKRVREEEWKSQVTTQHSNKKMNIMAFSPITSWEIDGEKVETVIDFISLGSKITADGDCSHKIKRRLLL